MVTGRTRRRWATSRTVSSAVEGGRPTTLGAGPAGVPQLRVRRRPERPDASGPTVPSWIFAAPWTTVEAVDLSGLDSQAEGRGFDPRLPLSIKPPQCSRFRVTLPGPDERRNRCLTPQGAPSSTAGCS